MIATLLLNSQFPPEIFKKYQINLVTQCLWFIDLFHQLLSWAFILLTFDIWKVWVSHLVFTPAPSLVKTDANKSFRFLAMSLLSLNVSSTCCLGWPTGYVQFSPFGVLSKCVFSVLTSYCLLFRFPLSLLKLHLNYYTLSFQVYEILISIL